MKKFIALLALVLTFTMSACSETGTPVSGTDDPAVTTSTPDANDSDETSRTTKDAEKTTTKNDTGDDSGTDSDDETTTEDKTTTTEKTAATTTKPATTTTTKPATTTTTKPATTTTTKAATTTTTKAATTTTTPKPVTTTLPPTPATNTTTTASSATIDSSKIISSTDELFSMLTTASRTLITDVQLCLSDISVFNSLKNKSMPTIGVNNYSIKYSNRDNYIEATITLKYNDYMYASNAYKTGNTSNLNSQQRAIYDKATSIINNYTSSSNTKFQNILSINNYLVQNTEYDYSFSESSFTAYGALINGRAVCQGYSEAAKLLLDMLGIENIIATGTAKNSDSSSWVDHAWNMVQLDNDWYHLDVTWNDPSGSSRTTGRYNYFNVTSSILSNDHQWDTSYFPSANGTRYNYYSYLSLEFSSLSALESYVGSQISSGQTEFDVLCNFSISKSDLSFLGNYIGSKTYSYSFANYGNGQLLYLSVK